MHTFPYSVSSENSVSTSFPWFWIYLLCSLPVGIVPPRTKSPTDESHSSSAGVSRHNGRVLNGMSRVCQPNYMLIISKCSSKPQCTPMCILKPNKIFCGNQSYLRIFNQCAQETCDRAGTVALSQYSHLWSENLDVCPCVTIIRYLQIQ